MRNVEAHAKGPTQHQQVHVDTIVQHALCADWQVVMGRVEVSDVMRFQVPRGTA